MSMPSPEFQELTDEATEEDRRLLLREEMKLHNVRLVSTAKSAGVVAPKDYAIFQDHAYRGLYGGLTSRDVHKRWGLKKSRQILDHMGSTELAANLFRATQTEEKLRRDKITGKERANRTHFEVGAKAAKRFRISAEPCPRTSRPPRASKPRGPSGS